MFSGSSMKLGHDARPDHRQDASLDGEGQRRPRIDHCRQFGVAWSILRIECAALCAASTVDPLFSR